MCGGTRQGHGACQPAGGLSPHVRGNLPRHMVAVRGDGPIPHARGNPQRGLGACGVEGPIPACAGEPCPAHAPRAAQRAYPRMCGGTRPCDLISPISLGLSPHVRGNQRSAVFVDGFRRPIPACAGELHGSQHRSAQTGAYPRMCGGTVVRSIASASVMGLSPHVRGNQVGWVLPRFWEGPIPACAGEPDMDMIATNHDRAYPRMCWGTGFCTPKFRFLWGLSPHVRGNLIVRNMRHDSIGPIPAYAGEPALQRWPGGVQWAYPRMCGGTCLSWLPYKPHRGLSPHVRGNREKHPDILACQGPIPACAGEPLLEKSVVIATGAYPRMCGGTRFRRRIHPWSKGLSPHVRGNQRVCSVQFHALGPIPACAGEPTWRSTPTPNWRAYPRMCGGTFKLLAPFTACRGLSPHVRGNL